MLYFIWSNEHAAWWKAVSRGYTTDLRTAGQYSFEEAKAICNGANKACKAGYMNEVMIPVHMF